VFYLEIKKRLLPAVLLIVFVFTIVAFAGVFSQRHSRFTVNVADVRVVSIESPYPLCTPIYYNDFESTPSDWVVFNATLTPRGYIAPQGYWGLTRGYSGSGLRGFPLVWQVREHRTYAAYSPDVRFTPQTGNAIRIDSYAAGASSLGNGYLFLITPRELFNNTVVNSRFDVYFSFSGTRTLGFIDLVNATIDRRDDAVIFSTYNDWNPYWRRYGTPSYIWLYNVSQAGGLVQYNVNSSVGDLSGYAPYLTYVITMGDYWIGQTVYFDVFWVTIYGDSTRIYNFTFPYGRYYVVLERSGTLSDYGYLDFGMTGFTGGYWSRDLLGSGGLCFSSKVKIASGTGWAGLLLTNTTRHYAVVVDTSGYLNILYYSDTTWTTLARWSIPGYTNNTWYTLSALFQRDSSLVIFYVDLYDSLGTRLLSVSFNSTIPTQIFTPRYLGLAVNTTNRLYIDAVFDDFQVAVLPGVNSLDMVVETYIGYGLTSRGPLFNVTIYPGETRYTYLWLDSSRSTIPSTLYLNLTLVNSTSGAATKIQILGGVVVCDTTSIIPLSGSGNYVLLEGYFTQPSQSATLILYVVTCSSPTLGVCTIIKVTVHLY
jgi:hypothetical protein